MSKVIITGEGEASRNAENIATAYSIDYLVGNAESKESALDEVFRVAPKFVGNMVFDGIDFAGAEGDMLKISAKYKYTNLELGGFEEKAKAQFSWDISAGEKHLTNALSIVAVWPSQTVLKRDLAIGWNGKYGDQCQVDGINVIDGSIRESYTLQMNYRDVDSYQFKRKIAFCYAHVNQKKFKDWEAGECLFCGCSTNGVVSRSEKIPVTFNFMIRLNQTNVPIGDTGKVFKKVCGWDIVDVITTDKPENGKIKREIKTAYVKQVYMLCDFDMLGL